MQDLLAEYNDYCVQHSSPLSSVLNELERATHLKTLAPRMLSGQLQGGLLSMISKLVRPMNLLEVGTFTGYSAICLAQGLQSNGKLITIENNEEVLAIAREFVSKAMLDHCIEFKVGNALEIIPKLTQQFDLVFLDADKESYAQYYELIKPKLNSGGLILADNVLWSGKVLSEIKDKKTQIIDAFNKMVREDDEVENILLPIRDGLNVIRKL